MSEGMVVVIACVRVSEGGENFEAEAYARERSKYSRVPCPECKALMFLGTRSAKYLQMNPQAARLMCSVCAVEITSQAEEVMQTNFAQFIDPPSD